MQLVLVVSDCPMPPDTAEPAGQEPPALPALSLALTRGARAHAPCAWQLRLVALAPVGGPASRSMAGVAAQGLPSTRDANGDCAWFAQPVHLQAAADHLRLPAGGVLRLAPEEQAALCGDFARVFGADGLALHALGDGGLLLTGFAADAGPVEPTRRLGERLDAASRGADPRLRRLASELELWLHDHAVNRARAQRAQPAVSALWLWGGERVSSGTEPRAQLALAHVYGRDAFIAGYAALLGLRLEPLPASFAVLLGQSSGKVEGDAVLVQLSAADHGGLAAIDEQWLQPALAAVRRGSLQRLRLLLLDTEVQMTRARAWRLWQRRRPWWETLRR